MTTLKLSPVAIERRPSGKPKFERRHEQLRKWLERRGPEGVGSFEIRQAGMSNPSQAAGELVAAGVPVSSRRERSDFASPMSRPVRYWLAEHAPSGATALKAAVDPHNPSPAPVAKTTGARPATTPRGRTGQGRAPVVPPSLSIFDVPGVGLDPHHEARKKAA